MSLTIRHEMPRDQAAVHALIGAAFVRPAQGPNIEQQIVGRLRADNALSLSLVAEDGGEVVGHIAISPVVLSDGSPRWFGLAPLAVLPARQRKGIGFRLAAETLAHLRALNAAGCVVLGEPEYYGRFGFRAEPSLVLRDVPPRYFQALCFDGAAPAATVRYHRAFDVAS